NDAGQARAPQRPGGLPAGGIAAPALCRSPGLARLRAGAYARLDAAQIGPLTAGTEMTPCNSPFNRHPRESQGPGQPQRIGARGSRFRVAFAGMTTEFTDPEWRCSKS